MNSIIHGSEPQGPTWLAVVGPCPDHTDTAPRIAARVVHLAIVGSEHVVRHDPLALGSTLDPDGARATDLGVVGDAAPRRDEGFEDLLDLVVQPRAGYSFEVLTGAAQHQVFSQFDVPTAGRVVSGELRLRRSGQ
jgi:hypothetical protein